MTEQPTDPEQPLVSPSAEPPSAEPPSAEPPSAEPLSAEPLSAEPLSAEPLSAGPAAADPAESAQDAVQLLVRAVGQLPPAERDRVYAWLISAGFRASAPDVPVPVPAQLARRLRWALRGEFEAAQLPALTLGPGTFALRGSSSSAQQMVPVRFPAEQHAQLREWCAEHGFSMATVIRGLVARFLEGQPPARA